MRKFISIAALLIALSGLCLGQQFVQTAGPLTATGVTSPIVENGGASNHTIVWTVTGSPTSCTIQLENSAAGSAFSLAGTAQTCTSNGSYSLTNTTANFWHVNLAALGGGTAPTVTVTYFGTPTLWGTMTDGMLYVPPEQCSGGTSGTAGAGNATDITAGSGGVRVFRLSATAAGASANTFTCVFNIPSRLTAGRGVTITDVTMLVSTQTTQPTSVTLPTIKSFSPPAAVDPETANSATFSAYCGTITQTPTSAQFAAYAAVTAGQFYTIKAACGTPTIVNTDLQTFQYVIVFNQSAAAISIQEVAGLYVHFNNAPL